MGSEKEKRRRRCEEEKYRLKTRGEGGQMGEPRKNRVGTKRETEDNRKGGTRHERK